MKQKFVAVKTNLSNLARLLTFSIGFVNSPLFADDVSQRPPTEHSSIWKFSTGRWNFEFDLSGPELMVVVPGSGSPEVVALSRPSPLEIIKLPLGDFGALRHVLTGEFDYLGFGPARIDLQILVPEWTKEKSDLSGLFAEVAIKILTPISKEPILKTSVFIDPVSGKQIESMTEVRNLGFGSIIEWQIRRLVSEMRSKENQRHTIMALEKIIRKIGGGRAHIHWPLGLGYAMVLSPEGGVFVPFSADLVKRIGLRVFYEKEFVNHRGGARRIVLEEFKRSRPLKLTFDISPGHLLESWVVEIRSRGSSKLLVGPKGPYAYESLRRLGTRIEDEMGARLNCGTILGRMFELTSLTR